MSLQGRPTKVIITLNREVVRTPEERMQTGRWLQREFGIEAMSESILRTLGVISGEVAPDCLHEIEKLPEVKSVERSALRRAQ